MTTVADVLSGKARWCVECGDSLQVLKALPDNCVDALVTDPPAGVSFMSATWDDDKGGRDEWIAWLAGILAEAARVLKPGAHAVIWSLPRTSHWTGMAIEKAGLHPRDVISHMFATGFPKSLDLSKAADKVAGATRPVIGSHAVTRDFKGRDYVNDPSHVTRVNDTAPATAAAAALQGWGSALKPSAEFWWLARKPFSGALIRNVLEHGTGGLNIDGCRVPHASVADLEAHAAGVAAIKERGGSMDNSWKNSSDLSGANDVTAAGRWPAHTVFSHSPECQRIGTKKVKAAPSWNDNRPASLFTGAETSPVHHADGDGFETVDDWSCANGCPVGLLDYQSGESTSTSRNNHADANIQFTSAPGGIRVSHGHDDAGGASRFFSTFEADPFIYEPKAPTAEKERGLDGFRAKAVTDGRTKTNDTPRQRGATKRLNTHPTAKSVALMRWLCRLVCPPGGMILDCFAGSGSTGVACSAEGFRFIGIEREREFVDIARARIEGDMPLFNLAGGAR